MTHMRRIPVLAFVSVVAGCSNPSDATLCRASLEPAVAVEIRDAITGAAIAAGARGVVRDEAYVDSLRPYESSGDWPADMYSRQAAHERAGIYSVEVHHEGYRPWTAEGVRVTRDECHVRTQTLRVDLVPEG